jgi:hypothetical protein
MKRHNVKWQVSLANGETLFEDKGDFCEVDGQPSPWQKLLFYLAKNKTYITSLSLYTDSNQRFNLPSAGKSPKFKAFIEAPKPLGFQCFRKMGIDFNKGPDGKVRPDEGGDLFTVAQAKYADCFMEIWVDENSPKNCWGLIIKK